MTGGRSIRALYFDYAGLAGHFPGCPAPENTFEVTQHQDRGLDREVRRTTLRLACHQCGSVFFASIDGPLPSTEQINAGQIGYGSKPEKVLGLWLWPGPRIWHGDDRGPQSYYVTRARERPRSHEDVIGIVGWHLGKRGAVKWGAGAGVTDHGTVRERSGDLSSRRAAVAWLAGQAGGAS